MAEILAEIRFRLARHFTVGIVAAAPLPEVFSDSSDGALDFDLIDMCTMGALIKVTAMLAVNNSPAASGGAPAGVFDRSASGGIRFPCHGDLGCSVSCRTDFAMVSSVAMVSPA